MLLHPFDAADPETVEDFEAGRDYYGRSPLPLMPCVDPPGMPGKIAEMERRAAQGLTLFAPGADAGEHDRIGFLGSRWGYAEDECRRLTPVLETSSGLKRLKPTTPPRSRRPSELNRDDVYRAWDRKRKRAERAKRKAEREAARAARIARTGKIKKSGAITVRSEPGDYP